MYMQPDIHHREWGVRLIRGQVDNTDDQNVCDQQSCGDLGGGGRIHVYVTSAPADLAVSLNDLWGELRRRLPHPHPIAFTLLHGPPSRAPSPLELL